MSPQNWLQISQTRRFIDWSIQIKHNCWPKAYVRHGCLFAFAWYVICMQVLWWYVIRICCGRCIELNLHHSACTWLGLCRKKTTERWWVCVASLFRLLLCWRCDLVVCCWTGAVPNLRDVWGRHAAAGEYCACALCPCCVALTWCDVIYVGRYQIHLGVPYILWESRRNMILTPPSNSPM